jgi:hypothetical protein
VALDPAWLGALLAGVEAAAFRQLVVCLRAPGRYTDDRSDIRRSIEDGYAYGLTAQLSRVVERVLELRAPGGETEDGSVEPEPIEDVLARADLTSDCNRLADALEEVTEAKAAARRCRAIQLAEAVALIPAMLLLPIPVWPTIADAHILTGALLHVANTVLAVSALAAGILFFMSIWADNVLDKALVSQAPRRERIGA